MKSSRPTMQNEIKKLKGPIIIFGAGGFIGINLLLAILRFRTDVIGISRDAKHSWRFRTACISSKNLLTCNMSERKSLERVIRNIAPQTIFNLAAYGAYANQADVEKIYETNFSSTISLLEIAKQSGFHAYIHAGSQSEYGLNASAPKENEELIPNSHYAVSKVSDYFLLKYYGKIEKLPVVHLRLYSAYGPWEEPDRLISVLLASARHGKFPLFVDSSISRDFVYIDDIVNAFILAAGNIHKQIYGDVFNVATGKQTTIKQLAYLAKNMFHIKENPHFGSMKNRKWDLVKWYGNGNKMKKVFYWKPQYNIKMGLRETANWQNEIQYDLAPWK